MTKPLAFKAKLCVAALMLSTSALGARLEPACAGGQDITDGNGDSFMQEEAPAPKPQKQLPAARINIINSDGTRGSGRLQSVESTQGAKNGFFMEEVDTAKGKGGKPYVNLTNVGVQVDPNGNTVPLIDHSGLPVRPLYSNTQAYQEMAVPYVNQTADNPLALPYTIDGQRAPVGTTFIPVTPGSVPFLRPSYNPYNGRTSFNPYSTGGISPYGGYPGGPGYGGVKLNLGNVHLGLGGNPYAFPGYGVGYPGYGGLGYPGYGGYGGYPGYGGYGGYGGGGLVGLGLRALGAAGIGQGLGGRSGFGPGLYGLGSGFGGPGMGGFGYGAYPWLGANSSLAYAGPGYASWLGGGSILGYNSGYYTNNPYYSPIWQQNPATWGGGTGVTSSSSLQNNSLTLPVPIERKTQSSYGTSTLIAPVLRDPKTSTGDMLEDAKRAGLWSNSSGQNNYNQGPLGGFSGGGGQQDQGITNGSGIR